MKSGHPGKPNRAETLSSDDAEADADDDEEEEEVYSGRLK